MKNEKNYMGFLIPTWNIANFEAFRWNISLSANFLFLKSAQQIPSQISMQDDPCLAAKCIKISHVFGESTHKVILEKFTSSPIDSMPSILQIKDSSNKQASYEWWSVLLLFSFKIVWTFLIRFCFLFILIKNIF